MYLVTVSISTLLCRQIIVYRLNISPSRLSPLWLSLFLHEIVKKHILKQIIFWNILQTQTSGMRKFLQHNFEFNHRVVGLFFCNGPFFQGSCQISEKSLCLEVGIIPHMKMSYMPYGSKNLPKAHNWWPLIFGTKNKNTVNNAVKLD